MGFRIFGRNVVDVGRTLEDTNRERISILPRSTKKPRKAQKQKVNWNNLSSDQKINVEYQLGQLMLQTLTPKIANSLDNTDQPYIMAKDLLKHKNGDIEEAVKTIKKINSQFINNAQGNEAVGDYWDYYTNQLPDIYLKGR